MKFEEVIMRYGIGSLALLLCLAGAVQAQDFGQGLFEFDGGSLAPAKQAEPQVSAALVPGDKSGVVTLQVRVDLPAGANTYSQDPDFAKPTKISLEGAKGWSPLEEKFTPHPPPKKAFDENFNKEVEKFYGTVVFTRRYYAPQGTDISSAVLKGQIEFLVCDKNNCRPHTSKFQAAYSKTSLIEQSSTSSAPAATTESDKKTAADQANPNAMPDAEIPAPPEPEKGETQDESSTVFGYEVTPKRPAQGETKPDPVRLQFELYRVEGQPTATLAITMSLAKNWTTYDLEPADETQIELPTTIDLELTNLRPVDEFVAIPEPEIHKTELADGIRRSRSFSDRVTWKRTFAVIDEGPIGIAGTVRYQICQSGESCLRPLSVPFSLGSMQQAAHVAEAAPIVDSYAQLKPKSPQEDLFALEDEEEISSLSYAVMAAFLAGLVLNVMPCVLPVLAIKILSLVQQAGESRGRMIALNLSYTAGVITVFLILATLAATLQMGWGSQFQNSTFRIVMILVVFAMGLSLLGVFELPIPGVIPSAYHHSEGLGGAFNTGIIATLLATPCTGPFMPAVFSFLIKQPAPVIYLIFGVMGLGMSFPYLLAGIFPAIVNWLPNPGMWMVRFKQFSGFIVLGTAIWLMFPLEGALLIPVLIMLLSVALALWMVGNLYNTASPSAVKWRTRFAALVLAGPMFAWGIHLIGEVSPVEGEAVAAAPQEVTSPRETAHDEMPWSQFSEDRMKELRTAGRPMLIDFTADWCVICKANEANALNTVPVVDFVREHGVVPMVADYTNENDEIRKWLKHFKQDSVPLTIIIPPGKQSKIIALRGYYSQSTLLEKLKLAMEDSAGDETMAGAPQPETAAVETRDDAAVSVVR